MGCTGGARETIEDACITKNNGGMRGLYDTGMEDDAKYRSQISVHYHSSSFSPSPFACLSLFPRSSF